MHKRIVQIGVKRMHDEHPDPSSVGRLTGEPLSPLSIPWEMASGWSEDARKGNAFFTSLNARTAEEARQDYDRMVDYQKGDWWYIGIRATARIETSHDGQTWLVNRVSSGGLWGIESDAGEEYFQEVRGEELAELAGVLEALGFEKDAITAAVAKAVEGRV